MVLFEAQVESSWVIHLDSSSPYSYLGICGISWQVFISKIWKELNLIIFAVTFDIASCYIPVYVSHAVESL